MLKKEKQRTGDKKQSYDYHNNNQQQRNREIRQSSEKRINTEQATSSRSSSGQSSVPEEVKFLEFSLFVKIFARPNTHEVLDKLSRIHKLNILRDIYVIEKTEKELLKLSYY